jgi:hypothetical protein
LLKEDLPKKDRKRIGIEEAGLNIELVKI